MRIVNKWLVGGAISLGPLMATIDGSVVNIVLPAMAKNLDCTLENITWVFTSYILAMVFVMPLTGFFAAIWGQKNFYLFSLLCFVVSSFLCGLATSLPMLVGFRFLQGLGAGTLQATQQAIIKQIFPANKLGLAIAIFSSVLMLGPALGPSLGGIVADKSSWPWVFYINVPLGFLGIFFAHRYYHESRAVKEANFVSGQKLRKNMDWYGLFLLCVCVFSMQYVLEEGRHQHWFYSSQILFATSVFVVSLPLLIRRELSYHTPIIHVRLFSNKTFLCSSIISAVVFGILMGSLLLLPLFMEQVLQMKIIDTGFALTPRALMMLVLSPIVGNLYNKVSPVLFMFIGVLLFIASTYAFSTFHGLTPLQDIIFALLVSGAGVSFLFVPIHTINLQCVSNSRAADAAGLSAFLRQVGSGVGIALSTTFFTSQSLSGSLVGAFQHVFLYQTYVFLLILPLFLFLRVRFN